MLINAADGAGTTKVVVLEKYHIGSSFILIGTSAAKSGAADILLEIPDTDWGSGQFDPSTYAGGWDPLTIDSTPIVLNDTNHIYTIQGAGIIRLRKTDAAVVAVYHKW